MKYEQCSLCLGACFLSAVLTTSWATPVCDPVTRPRESVPLCKPSTILLGAEKAGSTTLGVWLGSHPDIIAPVTGQHLVPREPRKVFTRTLFERFLKNPKDGSYDYRSEEIFLEHSNLTKEEVMAPGVKWLKNTKHPRTVLKELSSPIKVGGKEVRYWVPNVHRVIEDEFPPEEHIEWYYDVFPPIPAPGEDIPEHLKKNLGKVSLDASPMYLDYEGDVPKQVRKFLPQAKIVVTLRDPVEVFWSHVKFHNSMSSVPIEKRTKEVRAAIKECFTHRERLAPAGLKEFVDCMNKKVMLGFLFQKAMYSKKLRAWLQQFPRRQIYIVNSEELWMDPVKGMKKLEAWLGVRQMGDAFWKNITRFMHSPVWIAEERTFIIRPKEVTESAVDSEGKYKIRQRCPEDMRPNIELMYARTNCGLRFLLGQNWSEYGWRYCEQLGLPDAPFLVNRSLDEASLAKFSECDLPANHPKVGPWGHDLDLLGAAEEATRSEL